MPPCGLCGETRRLWGARQACAECWREHATSDSDRRTATQLAGLDADCDDLDALVGQAQQLTGKLRHGTAAFSREGDIWTCVMRLPDKRKVTARVRHAGLLPAAARAQLLRGRADWWTLPGDPVIAGEVHRVLRGPAHFQGDIKDGPVPGEARGR